MRFQDKVAIVTGGSSGIGKEVATRFVAEGGSVVIIGRDAAKAEAAAKQIDANGKRAIAHVGDISLPATGQAAVKAALDRFGRLDVLFNNAGIFGPKPFLDVTEDEYDRFLSIILKGKFFIAQAAAKAMNRPTTAWRDRADWLHVGPAGDRRHAVVGLFSGQWWRPCAGQEPRDRAGARQDPRERDRARRDRDPGLQHIPDAGAGEDRSADL